jgi:ABC-2 type transport system ATP-binding protein
VDAIKAAGLSKSYDGFSAVSGLELTVPQGTIYGLVGPNGAGKTTVIKMLTCLTRPTSGTAYVNGRSIADDPVGAKSMMGYLGENSYLYEDMSVRGYLTFFADIYGMRRADAQARISVLLSSLRVEDRIDSGISTLSKGLKRRVAIARALLHDPPVLILDEATSGLDPISVQEIRQYLKNLRSAGKTILISTHNLYEAELLCDRVTILNRGKAVAEGTVGDLKARFGGGDGPEAALERIFFRAIGDDAV